MKEKIKSIVDHFEAYWVKFEQYGLAVLMLIISYIWGKYNFGFNTENSDFFITFIFYLFLILLIICMIITHYFNKELIKKLKDLDLIDEQKEEINELQQAVSYFKEHQIDHAYKNVNSKLLAFIANNLNLDYTQRVSLYLVDKERNLFHIVGRYSKNGNFDRRHRKTFNINTGTLGHIWRCGTKEKICLPTDEKEYFKACKDKFGMLQKDVQKLAMQSREFYAIPITKDLSSQMGIILFEAEKCDTLKESDIDVCITDFNPILVQLLSQYEELSEITEGDKDE